MDLAALTGISSQLNVSNGVDLMMMKKVLDTAQQQGQAVQELIASSPSPAALERSVTPHLGSQVDLHV